MQMTRITASKRWESLQKRARAKQVKGKEREKKKEEWERCI